MEQLLATRPLLWALARTVPRRRVAEAATMGTVTAEVIEVEEEDSLPTPTLAASTIFKHRGVKQSGILV